MHWTQQGQRVEDPALKQIDAWEAEVAEAGAWLAAEAELEDIRRELNKRDLLISTV